MTTWADPVTDGNTTRYDGIDGLYTIKKWIWRTGDGTTSFTPEVSTVEYLVVAGGGAGGGQSDNNQNGGGGGAGGMLAGTLTGLTTSCTVTVGKGGVAPSGSGDNSVFATITSIGGGGGGGKYTVNGRSGGSSGGSTGAYNPLDTNPLDHSQGNIGSRGDNPACYTGGGGGGKSAPGGAATHDKGADGGAGSYSSITGTSTPYAGGGGGGGGYYSTTPGDGGVGGGGTGATTQYGTATSGTANTGGGGGGTFNGTAGNGGSGIVVIKYLTPISPHQFSGISLGSADMISCGC